MPNSYQSHTSNGALNVFSWADIDGYLSLDHIKVYLNGTLQATNTYSIDATARTVSFVPNAPVNGTVVRIARVTPNTVATRPVDFTDGSVLTANDLDVANLQTIFLAQEANDNGGQALQKTANNQAWNVQNIRLASVAAPVAGSDAATKDYIDNLALAGGAGGAPVAAPQSWTFTSNGGTTYSLANPSPSATQANMYLVQVGGVPQQPTTGYTISDAGVLTFLQAPTAGLSIHVRNFGIARSVTSSVTESLIAPNAITASKIANSAVTNDKIAPGIDTRKLAGHGTFLPRYTLTWYADAAPGPYTWRKMELPLTAAAGGDPYHPQIRFGRFVTFGNSASNMVTMVWGRIALKAPVGGVPMVDAAQIPAFPWGSPAQLRLDGLPKFRNDGWSLPLSVTYAVHWPNRNTGLDNRPEDGTMGSNGWLNGIRMNFQGAQTAGYPVPPQMNVSHWGGPPVGGYISYDPQAANNNQHVGVEASAVLTYMTQSGNLAMWNHTNNQVSNVFAGSSPSYAPWTGAGGNLVPSAPSQTDWIPATALLMPNVSSAEQVCELIFWGIVGGGDFA